MQAVKICLQTRNLCRFIKNNAHLTRFSAIIAPKYNTYVGKTKNFDGYRLGSFYCTTAPQLVDHATFEKVCEETLESLTEYFEQIVEEADNLKSGDVSYSSGVLTVNLGPQFGTYVINRQSPNRQIWLSSPFSGPKRYDFITEENCWVYKHDGKSLHGLLQNEMSKIVSLEVNFANCMYGKL